MEYDPASPTDEPEDCSTTMDLSSIPLPGPPLSAPSDFLDIPLPSAAPDITFPADVHSPPHTTEGKIAQSPDTGMDISENESTDVVTGPLKFSIKTAKPLSGQDNGGDSSGIFESSKESKTEDAKAMPKLQAMMKRSKPCQLPVGVLPSRTKLPHVEAKSELFLPSKDSDANGNALLENPPQVPLLPTNITTSLNSIMDSTDTLFTSSGSSGVVNLATSLIDPMPISLPSISDNTPSLLSNLGLMPASFSSLMSNVLPGVGSTSSYIPNLMSLTVQPVPTINTLPVSVGGIPGDPTAILRQPKMNMANMQYVNPQKLRSAQMIATPLIANPALAGQHQSEELIKKRESRRRSRSRSRSTSRRRGRYRGSSSSSASSSPRRSTYRSRRRSRSYSRRSRSSSGNYSRKYEPSRYSREKRDSDRRRDPRRDRSNSLNNLRDGRRDINSIRRNSRSKEPNIKENKRPRSKSPRGRLEQSKDVQSAKESTRSTGKSHSQSNNATIVKSKDRTSKMHTPPKSERPSENKEKSRSSRSEDERKRPGSVTKKSDSFRRQTLADLIERERSPSHRNRPVKDIQSSKSKSSTGDRLKSSRLSTKSSEKVVKKKHVSSNGSDRGSELGTRSSSSPEPSNDKKISGEPDESAKSRKSSGRRSHRNSPLKNSVIGADNVGPSTFAQECPASTVAAESESMDLESATELDVASALNHLTHEQILATAQDIEKVPEAPDKQHLENDLCQTDSLSHDDQGACRETESTASALEITHDCRGLSIMNSESAFHEADSCLSKSSVIDHGDCDRKLKEEEEDCTTEASSKVDHDRSTHLKLEDSKTGEFKYHLRKRVQKPQNGESERAGCLNVNYLGHNNQPVSPRSAFAAFPDAPTPQYSHISENDYSLIKSSSVPQSQSSFRASLLGSSNLSHHEMRQWVCDCTVPSSEQISMGLMSCGHGCINRALNIECGSHCLSGKYCGNRQFQQLAYAPSKPVYCGPEKGWGLVSTAVIPRNTFMIEYVGEVIDFLEFKRRVRRYERLGRSHHYFMALESDTFIDSGSRGNWARFVNHSCEPNCTTQKWSVDGKIRIGFFSKSQIAENEEITIDYQFVQFGATEQKCYCGTTSCSGVMGYTSKQLQDKVRLKDTSMVERRVIRLLQLESFRSAEDITLLLQVMVQECLTRYTRLELLRRLAATDSDICLKLFRQYNGLDMIAAFMCDAEPTDWVLKKQILLCLERIPVSEQKQVQTPSRLMEIVTLWTSDPRYCRPRGSTSQSHSLSQVKESGGDDETTLPDDDSTVQNKTSVSPCSPSPHVSDPKLVKDGAFKLHFNGIYAASSSDGSKASADSDIISTEIPPEGNKTLSSVIEEPSLEGDGDCNGSITIDLSSSVVSSEHPSPTDCELNMEAQSLAEVSESSSTPYVDEEIQGVESIADHDESSDQSLVQEIQELATKIIERWSKLPWETYRIPRVERQETEEILHGCRSSPLIALGTVLNDQNELPTSWRQSEFQRTVKGSKNRSKLNRAAKKMFSGNNPPPSQKSGDLSKAERRRIFEAQVSAAEANKLIEKVASITEPEGVESADHVRQLLLCSLLAELQQPDGAQGLSFDKPSELAETETEKSSAVSLLKLLLHTLPPLVARLPPERSLSMITRLCEDMRYESEKPGSSNAVGVENEIASTSGSVGSGGGPSGTPSGGAQDLPPNWQTAVDATGRTYFYNMQTKVVQWERPTALGVASSPRAVAVAVAAAATDSFPVDEDTRKRMVKAFSVKVTDHILRLLKPYQLPNCVTGRIVSKGDLVHITKKLSRAFVAKETKRSTRPPIFNDILAECIRSRLTQYMVSHGPVYTRRQKQTISSNTLSSVHDNLSPDFT